MEAVRAHTEKRSVEWVLVLAVMILSAVLIYPRFSQQFAKRTKIHTQAKRPGHPPPGRVETVTPIVYLRSV